MQTRATIDHIVLDDHGVAWIDDTNVKVVEVVVDKLTHNSSAEEMHFQYPHLSVAQIYSALAYYHDHQAELDQEIEERQREIRAMRDTATETPGRKKLGAKGLFP